MPEVSWARVEKHKFLIQALALNAQARVALQRGGVKRFEREGEQRVMIAQSGKGNLRFVAGNHHRLGQPRELFAAMWANWFGGLIYATLLGFRHDAPFQKAADIVFHDAADEIPVTVLLAGATLYIGEPAFVL